VQRLLVPSAARTGRGAPRGIQRQPNPGPGQSGGTHTITDPNAVVRGGPPDFKPTGEKPIPVGTRVDVGDTQTSTKGAKGTFVKVGEHGTTNELGWTARSNPGDAQYAQAAANFVYEVEVKIAQGTGSQKLPILVYLPPNFAPSKADVVLYFHGDAANYSASEANNYTRENPAIGMNLQG